MIVTLIANFGFDISLPKKKKKLKALAQRKSRRINNICNDNKNFLLFISLLLFFFLIYTFIIINIKYYF